ncbi:hypothetical protein [Aurantivibrio infirmus]
MTSLRPLSILYISKARPDFSWIFYCALILLLLGIPFPFPESLLNNSFIAVVAEYLVQFEEVLYAIMPLLGFVFALKWFAGFDGKDIGGTQSCIPEFLLSSPATTTQLVVIPSLCGLVLVSLSRFISAPQTISNEGLIAITSTIAVYFWLQAILWQRFPIRYLRVPLLIAVIAFAYVVNINYRNQVTTSIDTNLLASIVVITIIGYFAAFFAAKGARHRSDRLSFPSKKSTGKELQGLSKNRSDFKNSLIAHLYFEFRISGYLIQIIFVLLLALPVLVLFLDRNEPSVSSNLLGLYLVSLFFIPLLTLFFMGIGKGIIITNRKFDCVSFSPFFAVLPVATYRLVNAKYAEMIMNSFLTYGLYFLFCAFSFQKYTLYFSGLLMSLFDPLIAYSLHASIVFCSICFGVLAYLSLPWLGSVLRRYSQEQVKVWVVVVVVMGIIVIRRVVEPYVKAFSNEDIPDIQLAVVILCAIKATMLVWSSGKFKELKIPLSVLQPFAFAWLTTIAGLSFIAIQLVPEPWQNIYFVVGAAFLITPILGIILNYVVISKNRFS